MEYDGENLTTEALLGRAPALSQDTPGARFTPVEQAAQAMMAQLERERGAEAGKPVVAAREVPEEREQEEEADANHFLKAEAGMALENKVFTALDATKIEGSNSTPSAKEMTKQGASYHDPLTGEIHTARNAFELMEKLKGNNPPLVPGQPAPWITPLINVATIKDNQRPVAAGGKGWTGSEVRKTTVKEWFQGQIVMSQYRDPEHPEKMDLAHKTIAWAIANPRYVGTENAGQNNGGVQQVPVDGRRGLIMWGVHENQGVDDHVMFFAHIRALKPLDDKNDVFHVSKPVDWIKGELLQDETDWINENLQKVGLDPIPRLGKYADAKGAALNKEAALIIGAAEQEAARAGVDFVVPEPVEPEAQTGSQAVSIFSDLAKKRRSESLQKWTESQSALAEAKALEAAAASIRNAELLQEKLTAERETTAKLTTENGELKETLGELKRNLFEITEKLDETTIELTGAKNDYEAMREEAAEYKTDAETQKGLFDAEVAARKADAKQHSAALQAAHDATAAEHALLEKETIRANEAERDFATAKADLRTEERARATAEARAELEISRSTDLTSRLEAMRNERDEMIKLRDKEIATREEVESKLQKAELDRDAEIGRATGLQKEKDDLSKLYEAAKALTETQAQKIEEAISALNTEREQFAAKVQGLADREAELARMREQMDATMRRMEEFMTRSGPGGPGGTGGTGGPSGSGGPGTR